MPSAGFAARAPKRFGFQKQRDCYCQPSGSAPKARRGAAFSRASRPAWSSSIMNPARKRGKRAAPANFRAPISPIASVVAYSHGAHD
jgi:hypothetical protein